jgi:hypothetical protein
MKISKFLVLTLIFCLLASFSAAQSIDEPRFVNKFLGDFETPVIEPGGEGTFSFSLNNPDAINLTSSMTNVQLNASIYRFATLDESRFVSDITDPPIILASGSSDYMIEGSDLAPGQSREISITVSTSKETPHGGVFNQATYFVRFWLEFDYESQHYVMASRGYFSDEEWALVQENGTIGQLNLTYLNQRGLDGIIPDSGFAVKEPMPLWPVIVLVALMLFFSLLAFSFWVLDNPGRFPKMEKRLLRLAGKTEILKMRIFKGKIR